MKIVIARCDECNAIVYEWPWKRGDIMDNADLCGRCRYGRV